MFFGVVGAAIGAIRKDAAKGFLWGIFLGPVGWVGAAFGRGTSMWFIVIIAALVGWGWNHPAQMMPILAHLPFLPQTTTVAAAAPASPGTAAAASQRVSFWFFQPPATPTPQATPQPTPSMQQWHPNLAAAANGPHLICPICNGEGALMVRRFRSGGLNMRSLNGVPRAYSGNLSYVLRKRI